MERRRNPGQTVSTSGNIKYSARRHASSGRHDRRRVGGNKPKRRRTALCNTPQNYDSIGVGSKGYGQDKEDLRTNGPRRISKARTDLQRKRVTSIPTNKTMGSRYRAPTGCSKGIRLQNIPYGERRRRIAEGIHQRTIGEGVYTTIKTNLCLFEPCVMFFGLTTSPSTFQTMLDTIFRDLTATGEVVIYMDDILIATPDHIPHH